jgi:hypothetical protein
MWLIECWAVFESRVLWAVVRGCMGARGVDIESRAAGSGLSVRTAMAWPLHEALIYSRGQRAAG